MSDKIPTAEEVLQSNLQFSQDGHPIWNENTVLKAMKEYGNNIREAALKAAYDNQVIEQYKKEEKYDYPDSSHFRATKQSILNAYPKENIK